MSRRKQSRPRHVDNDGLGLEAEGLMGVKSSGLDGLGLTADVAGGSDPFSPAQKRHGTDDMEDAEDEKMLGNDDGDDFCPSDEAPSPRSCDNISSCQKCGICFSDIGQYIAHKKLCGSRNRILMPYDPPVNGYLRNGFDFSRSSLDLSMGKDFSDGEFRDDKDDFESVDEEERLHNDSGDYNTDPAELKGKRKRRPSNNEEDGDSGEVPYPSRLRPEESFLMSALHGVRERRLAMTGLERDMDGFSEDPVKDESEADGNEDGKDGGWRKLRRGGDVEVEKGLYGSRRNVKLAPLASTTAAVAQCQEGLTGCRPSVPEEVNMFRSMLFQLQQQQMMQIHMIQQMRRQLIASGVNPSLLPADIDLNMMSSEGLASVGAVMSGLQSATSAAAAVAREARSSASSSRYSASMSPSHGERSRDSSPAGSSHKGGDRLSSPASVKSSPGHDHERITETAGKLPEEDKKLFGKDPEERYLSPTKSMPPSFYSMDSTMTTPLTRNPLEILQETAAASLNSLPLSLGFRSSSSEGKPASSSSSLLNSSALFASSPSLSALQKETDALKPSPILPPINLPMSAEDYKGYIQRGTILERSQYASDDPFFKHKCRFCHKVFGSDSALQIHVRSHTGERPFKCNICGNRFSTKGNLKVHFERHKAKYPHIKMDATPVPEHLDRQPGLLPNFSPAPLPPPVPLPPPLPRLPLPPVHHGSPVSPSPSPHSHHSHPSPFSAGFGPSFLSPLGHGLPPFGLMPPHLRDNPLNFPPPLSLSLPSSLSMPMPPLYRDSMACRDSPPVKVSGSLGIETSVIRSPRKESPLHGHREASPSDARRPGMHLFHPNMHSATLFHHHLPRFDPLHRYLPGLPDRFRFEGISSEGRLETNRDHEDRDFCRPRSRHGSRPGSAESRSPSPPSTRGVSEPERAPTAPADSPPPPPPPPPPPLPPPPPPLLQPPLSHSRPSNSPRRSPASVISWASLTSSQAPLLPSHHHHHHPIFSHPPLPPGFPGLSLPLPVTPTTFPLPPNLNHMLPMHGGPPRLNGHSPFLPLPLPPPPLPPHVSPPPTSESSVFRNSILPTKTIDPSENLEQYMEVQKSETSKLEALVKNIEQKITDPNQCVVCHRVLSCKSALQMHYRIHTGERPFKCKICGRSFTTKGNLKTHMGVHRAKPALRMMHQCPVCHKQFTNVLVLQQHIRAHTGSMQHHLPPMPLLPSHIDWSHRPPFGLNRHHPYLPPVHHDRPSLDLAGISMFPPSRPTQERALGQENEANTNRDKFPASKTPNEKKEEQPPENKTERHSEDIVKEEDQARPRSQESHCSDDKIIPTPARKPSPLPGSSSLIKPEFETTFLPPCFGNTPFDAPLAALEERVKAIDSQLSQTSFEKFRNSMGLDSSFFPSSSNAIGNDRILDFGDHIAKRASPTSGSDLPAFGFSLLGVNYDQNSTTCNICLKTFACKSALDIHYRSHTKLKPFQCDVCERSFSTRGNLKQHLLTHKIRDIPSHAFSDLADQPDGEDNLEDKEDRGEDDDDPLNELPNADYPFEEDEMLDEEGFDPDMDRDDDLDDDMDDFNEPAESDEESSLKSSEFFHEDNNNISSFQNHNGSDHSVLCSEGMTEENGAFKHSKHSDSEDNTSSDMPNPSTPNKSQPQPTSRPQSGTQEIPSPCTPAGPKTSQGGSGNSTPSNSHGSSSIVKQRLNGPKHQCMTCMKPFSSASALQIHTRTHTGDKPFKCTVCSKAFTTRGNLKVHMGTHMWNNSPSRRGRRMSIEPPFLLSHMKDAPFMSTGFPPRPPLDFFYQYPLPMLNGPDHKLNDLSVMPNRVGTLPPLPPLPPLPSHFMQGLLPREDMKSPKDIRSSSDFNERLKDVSDKPLSSGELDLSTKISSVKNSSSFPSTPSSSSSSSLSSSSSSLQSVLPPALMTSAGTHSPNNNINNKENSLSVGLELQALRTAPWLWPGFHCHQCGQMFPLQESLEHHIRTHHHHLGRTDNPGHPMAKSDPRASMPPKALLA